MTFATLVNQLIINTLSLPPPVSGGGRKSSCFMKADKKKRCLYPVVVGLHLVAANIFVLPRDILP